MRGRQSWEQAAPKERKQAPPQSGMAPFRRDPEGQKPPREFLLEVGGAESKERQVRSRKFLYLPLRSLRGPRGYARDPRSRELAQQLRTIPKPNGSNLGSICPTTLFTWELNSP